MYVWLPSLMKHMPKVIEMYALSEYWGYKSVGYPMQTETSSKELIYPRLKEHCGKGDRHIIETEDLGAFVL